MLIADQPTTDYRQATRQLVALLEEIEALAPFPGRLRRTGLGEAWFSDMLAWLLDVKGSHGLGTAFADRFLVKIATRRNQGHPDEGFAYAHRKGHLRFGRQGIVGTPCTGFRLGNSAVFREFYLANGTGSKTAGSAALCDVVFLDLDARDGLFVAVENKLFTRNRTGQLENYHRLIESRYARATVREYVYLTLTGEAPVDHGPGAGGAGSQAVPQAVPQAVRKAWVRLGWLTDVLEVLDEMPAGSNRELIQLRQVLLWLKTAMVQSSRPEGGEVIGRLLAAMVTAAVECIFAELVRLNEGARGQWQIIREGKNASRLVHSSKPKAPLYVGVMPNLSIALYGPRGRRRPFDKLLIPFGSNPDQIFNLMDFAARDIYQLHFGASYRSYLGKGRRLTAREVPERQAARRLFQAVHRHRHQIQLLGQVARRLGGNQEPGLNLDESPDLAGMPDES